MKDVLSLCAKAGITDPEIKRLKGDYSERKIFRINSKTGTVIAVSGSNINENVAFLSFRETFEQNDFNVPKLIAVSEDRSAYLIEDLGDITVNSFCKNCAQNGDVVSIRKIYKDIMTLLPQIQTALYDRIDYSKCCQDPVFDKANMQRDTLRFEEFFLKKYYKRYDPLKFRVFINEVIDSASVLSTNYFMFRDFQSRNIMLKDDKLYLIDFQSGRKGSFYYDAASFIYSSGTADYDGMEDDLSSYYYNASRHICDRYDVFRQFLSIFGCLRIMQAAGNYAYYYYERKDFSVERKMEHALETLHKLSSRSGLNSGIEI
ncbi:MAG TPA: phosphotransferase [Clostridiales bacterium]|nr:phosphotransferase [Clostridiales bacterium]